MSLIKAFFFDLDGTLVNTYEADYLAYRDAIMEITGIPVTQPDFDRTHGKEMRHKLADLTPSISEDEILQIGVQKKVHYAKYLHLTKPNKPLIDFLRTLSQDDQKIVLVTTAKRHNAMLVLEAHDISQYFSEMVFGDEVTASKPHPEPYLIALEKTGLNPGDVIAFEDSDAGVASATAANIPVIRIRSFA